MYSLLKELCQTHGVTSDTLERESLIKKTLKSLGIKYDTLGHGAIICGNMKSPKKLISAHIDEVGFQVTHIEEDGKIKILPVGWIFAGRLDHSVIYIKTDKGHIPGMALHTEELKVENLKGFESIYVDVGCNSRAEVEAKGIKPGQSGTYQRYYHKDKDNIIASGLDNNISATVVLDLIKENPDFLKNNIVAFITDEEMQDHSANGLGFLLKPDLAVILDYCPIHQKPGPGDIVGETGSGPIVPYRGGHYIVNSNVRRYLEENIKLPYQKAFFSSETLPTLEPANFEDNGHTVGVNVCVPAYGYHGNVYSARINDVEDFRKFISHIIETDY